MAVFDDTLKVEEHRIYESVIAFRNGVRSKHIVKVVTEISVKVGSVDEEQGRGLIMHTIAFVTGSDSPLLSRCSYMKDTILTHIPP